MTMSEPPYAGRVLTKLMARLQKERPSTRSMVDIARDCHMKPNHISMMARGDVKFRLSTLQALVSAFGYSASDIHGLLVYLGARSYQDCRDWGVIYDMLRVPEPSGQEIKLDRQSLRDMTQFLALYEAIERDDEAVVSALIKAITPLRREAA